MHAHNSRLVLGLAPGLGRVGGCVASIQLLAQMIAWVEPACSQLLEVVSQVGPKRVYPDCRSVIFLPVVPSTRISIGLLGKPFGRWHGPASRGASLEL